MGRWTRQEVNPDTINGGNEYEKKDRISREQLNAIVNASFYAQDLAKQASRIQAFKDVVVSTWTADTTHDGFGYRADISIAGVTANDFAEVVFGQTEAASGNYANVSSTGAGIVTIYSKVNTEITIPTIIVIKGVGA